MSVSAAASSAAARSAAAACSISERCADAEVVDDLRLLFEVGQLGVVELVTPGRERVELTHQRLGLTRREHRLQLALQTLPVVRQLRPRPLRLLDRLVELALPGQQRGDAARGAGELGGRRFRRGPLGKMGATVGELADRRVDVLQFQQVVAQHAAIRYSSGTVFSGARGSRTLAGIVVPESTRL